MDAPNLTLLIFAVLALLAAGAAIASFRAARSSRPRSAPRQLPDSDFFQRFQFDPDAADDDRNP